MNCKKTGKFALAASAAVLLLAAENSQASIFWCQTVPSPGDPYVVSQYQNFTFAVQNNGGNFYQMSTGINGIDNQTKTAGSYADTTVTTSPNVYPLAGVFSMNAGAQGTGSAESPSDGLSVKAYAEMEFEDAFDNSDHLIFEAHQIVSANVMRRLSVDADGQYTFSAEFSGDTFFPGANPLISNASLTGFYIDSSNQIMALTVGTNLPFDMSPNSS
ncbi:MAG: hypothetical protein E4H16_00455, partial [Candidatus Atribacteria bacterium]